MENYFLIGNVSKILNIPVSTLRYYDAIGLLSPKIKGENNYRYYSEDQLMILKGVKTMRNLGLSLEKIKKFLNNSSNILEMMDETLKKIRNNINTYQIIEKNILEYMVNYYKNEGIQINTPFFEKIETEERGVEIFNFKNKRNIETLIKSLKKIEKKNNKIKNTIIEISEEHLEGTKINEIGYVNYEEEKLNNKLIIKNGNYISIYGKGLDKRKNIFNILKKYIEDNKLKINSNIYISFQKPIMCWRKEDILFKIRILLNE